MFLAGKYSSRPKQANHTSTASIASCGNSEIGSSKSSTHEMSETDRIEIYRVITVNI